MKRAILLCVLAVAVAFAAAPHAQSAAAGAT